MDRIEMLRKKLQELVEQENKIFVTAQAAGKLLGDEDRAEVKKIAGERVALEEEIELNVSALEAQARLEKPAPSKVSSEIEAEKALQEKAEKDRREGAARAADQGLRRPPITRRDAVDPADSPTQGFASQLEWFRAVRNAAINPGLIDRRLTAAQAAATVFANEGAGPEGAWAQPAEYSKTIVEAVTGQGTLLGRMKPIPSTSNIYQIPVDESTQWGTTGVQAAKTAEGAATTATNLALQGRVVTLYKAVALVNVSEELTADNPATIEFINRIMARQLNGVVERWLLRGSGVGEPVGILSAPSLISVTAESSGNTSGTLLRRNLSKCSGRLMPGTDSEAFWVLSPSAKIEVEDMLLTAGGNTGRDLQAGFQGTLLGKPYVTSMEAQAVGTAGDATAVAPSGFLTLTRGGITQQATIFFYFDQGLQTLRAYMRIGQTPLLSTPVVPKLDTSTTLSHCVTTATRTG
jgi:HK97 family phage major capsid protein